MSAGWSQPPSVLQPRGRISPRLPRDTPLARRLIRGVRRLAEGIYHHDDIFHMAPAMAFHFFLSLMPLLVFVGYVVSLVSESAGVSAVFALLLQSANLPASSQAVVGSELGRLESAHRLGPLAALGFLWIASGGTQGLMQAIERVVGAPRRVWWRQRLFALAWVLGTMVAFGFAALGSIQWEDVVRSDDPASVAPRSSSPSVPGATPSTGGRHPADGVPGVTAGVTDSAPAPSAAHTTPTPPRGRATGRRVRAILRGGGERVLAMTFALFTAVGGLAGFYQFSIAHTRRVRRRVIPGALLAIGLVVVISWGFSLYVRTLASYTVYYGSLAAIAVLLIWLWLASVAILVGAELNSQLEGLRD